MKRTYNILLSSIVLMTVVTLIFINAVSCVNRNRDQDENFFAVEGQTLVRKSIDNILALSGPVEAVALAKINSDAAGTLESIEVIRGEQVNKGQVIAYVNASQAGQTFLKSPVRSTIKGYVADIFVKIGSSVLPSSPIVEVVDTSQLQIRAAVSSDYSAFIKENTKGTLTFRLLNNNNVYDVLVYSISNVFSAKTHMANVQVYLTNASSHIKSGMFGLLELVLDTHENVFVVSKNTIVQRYTPDGDFVDGVFIIKSTTDKDVAVFKKIEYGIQQADIVEIIGDFKVNDIVVVAGQSVLADGKKAQIFVLDGKNVDVTTKTETQNKQ